MREDQAGELLGKILSGESTPVSESLGARSRAILQSVIAWRAGVEALQASEAEAALEQFDRASRLSPSSPLFKIDAVMALAHLARWEEVDRRLAGIIPVWRGDPRLPAALAVIGLARGDLDAVERESSGPLAEQYFLGLLWQGESTRAEQFAEGMLARAAVPEQSLWRERLGDAAFLSGNTGRARGLYELSLDGHPQPGPVWLKLSDVYFKLGDLEKERTFRERIYGGLGGR